ncbi:MAG: sigma-70 family RNA polymerase sigma factor [Verrucomicrobium sp.]|nr:sigma-70 family RNA polymerase sigma factor [Verrucomicrobium sp.]
MNLAIHPPIPMASWARSPEAPGVAEIPSDAEIVRAVREGDADRFGELVRRHQARLFALARRYLRREEDVADLVQEVLVKAFSRLDSWRGDAPFEHWLMRLATRACLDALRSRRRRPEDLLSDLSADESDWLDRHAADTGEGDPGGDEAHRGEVAHRHLPLSARPRPRGWPPGVIPIPPAPSPGISCSQDRVRGLS